jgi:lipopolysaccharide transport system permease protein
MTYPAGPGALVSSLGRNRGLVRQLAVREVIGRYRGSWMGLFWSFLHPLLMLAVYTFVFGFVFQARWGGQVDNKADFAVVLFAGLIVHALLAECVNRAPHLVLGNPSYVKKVVFPLEILPWVVLGSSLFHAAVSFLVLLCVQFALTGSIPLTVFWLPLVLAPFGLVIVGMSWFLAAFAVYVRDVAQIVGILTTVMLFISPIFYPVSALPPAVQPLLYLNPLTFIVDQVRSVALWGHAPDWIGLGWYTLVGIAVAWLGYVWFQKTRRGFADVL